MAFYTKYRSKNFSDLIGQDHVRDTLMEAIKSGKLSHAYLMTGPRGTGKTSTARLLAKAFNCENISKGEPCNECSSCKEISSGRSVDVIEIDAASHTGVDEIRELIEKAQFAPAKSKMKVYIIDEVHMLSKSAFNALLKTLEEPPKHVAFILATTEAYKLPATILSRVQRYDFHRVSKDDIVKNLKVIVKAEGISIDDNSLELIASNAQGGHRDAIVLLEKVASFGKAIDRSQVENILGVADRKMVHKFLGAIFNDHPEEGLKIAHELYENGFEMMQFNRDIIEVLRRILLITESGEALFEDTRENINLIKELSKGINGDRVVKLIEIFLRANDLLKDIAYPILPIEMAIIESCSQEYRIQNTELSREQDTDKLQITNIKSPNSASAVIPAEAGIQNDILDPQTTAPTSPSLPSGRGGIEPEDDKESGLGGKGDIQEDKIEKPEAKPLAPNAPLPATVPVAVFQMTDDIWIRAIGEIKKGNHTLAALLQGAKPLECSADKLVIGFKFKFHKEKASAPENIKILEKSFGTILGKDCIITCKLMEVKPKEAKKSDEDLAKAATEIFS